jgi:hypothetical protein
MTLLETLQDQRSQILAIAAKHGAHNVRAFGSAVDLDIVWTVEVLYNGRLTTCRSLP